MLRFLGLWAAITAAYSMTAVCPWCGQQGCPVGLGVAGIFGAVGSLFLMRGRGWLRTRWRKLTGRA